MDESLSPETPRSIRRKLLLFILATMLALIGIVSGTYYFATRPTTLKIAVGPPNSDDFKMVQGLAQLFARQQLAVRLRPVATENPKASAAALAEQATDLAVIRGDLDVPKNAQAVATMRKNVVVMWVPARQGEAAVSGPPITKIADLAGRRVGVIGYGISNIQILKIILRQYSIDPDKVEVIKLQPSEALDAIRKHRADAFLAAIPIKNKIPIEIINAVRRDEGAPTFLAIGAADAIAQSNAAYEADEIPAGAFGGSPSQPEGNVKTLSFNHYIVAQSDLSENVVATLTRQIFAVRQAAIPDYPMAARIEAPDTDKDAAITAHPGAAAYVDGEEKSFMDRYGDYIWWSLMGLSAIGSVGAWFASYLRKGEPSNAVSLRGQLLEMLAKARQSNSIDELDRMQADADEIMRRTLDGFERGGIGEGSLTAFSIALEQFHNAVADRKSWLGDHAQRKAPAEAVPVPAEVRTP